MQDSKTGALTGEDKRTIQTAAHGVVTLMASADPGVISSTRAGIAGGKAMSTATGLIGHVLAEKPSGLKLKGKERCRNRRCRVPGTDGIGEAVG